MDSSNWVWTPRRQCSRRRAPCGGGGACLPCAALEPGIAQSDSGASKAITIATSATLRACTPTWSKRGDKGMTPSMGIAPWAGLKPTTPHRADGRRTEPKVSVPSATGAMPAATAAALPPEEPPGMCAGLCGLRVVWKAGLAEVSPSAPSCMLNMATGIMPAARSRATQAASRSARRSRNARMPPCQGWPPTAMLAFTPKGMPSNGERGAPWRQRSAAASAASSKGAGSSRWLQTPRAGSHSSIRRRQAASTSVGRARPSAKAALNCWAPTAHSHAWSAIA